MIDRTIPCRCCTCANSGRCVEINPEYAIAVDAENAALRALLRDIEAAAKPPGTEVGWSDPPWSDLYDRIWAEVHGPKPERTADQPTHALTDAQQVLDDLMQADLMGNRQKWLETWAKVPALLKTARKQLSI